MKIRWYLVVEVTENDEFIDLYTMNESSALNRASYLLDHMSVTDLLRTRVEVRFADMPEGSDPENDYFIDDFFKYGYDLIDLCKYIPENVRVHLFE